MLRDRAREQPRPPALLHKVVSDDFTYTDIPTLFQAKYKHECHNHNAGDQGTDVVIIIFVLC